MHDCSNIALIVPEEFRFLTKCGDSCTVIVIQLICKLSDTEDIDGRVGEIEDILNQVRMFLTRVVFPTPSDCTDSGCFVSSSANCCNCVACQRSYLINKHLAIVTNMNICTVITDNSGSIAIKIHR